MKHTLTHNFTALLLAVLLLVVLVGILVPQQTYGLTILNQEVEDASGRGCDPTVPAGSVINGQQGCGLVHFIATIRIVINYLVVIALPLVAAFIVWGGIVIMSAAGSTERVAQGKKTITAAIIGLIILLSAWLIISLLYQVLPLGDVGDAIRQALFGN